VPKRSANHDPDPDPDGLDLGWNLSVLFRAYLARSNEAFVDLPGGPRGYQLLAGVERAALETQLAIGRRLGIDRTAVTYLVDDMVEAGLVERRVSPTDRRARVIVATARGRRLLPEYDRRLATIEAELLAPLDAADAAALRRLLRTAAAELDGVHDPGDIPRQMSPTSTGRPT
jgi:MarR family transcriptional regulator for hemolysin